MMILQSNVGEVFTGGRNRTSLIVDDDIAKQCFISEMLFFFFHSSVRFGICVDHMKEQSASPVMWSSRCKGLLY